MKHALGIVVTLLGLALSPGAHAAELTELTSAFDKDNPFDAHFSVGYSYSLSRGAIKRERVGEADQRAIKLVKEARYSQIRHFLNLRAEFGIWKDLQFHIALPITLSDSRTLSFAQNGGSDCKNPGIAGQVTDNCVTPANSTIVADGFLDRAALEGNNFRVIDWGSSSPPPGGLLLPNRAGVDQLHFGISWAPVSQARDSTKPTFVLGFEARIAIGSAMRYNPADKPDTSADDPTDERARTNTSVGQGIHQLHWYLDVSRRFNRWVEPFFSFWYMLPIAASSSLFSETTFDGSGQERAGPQHIGGFRAGMEIVPWEEPAKRNKVSIELRLHLTGYFEGRGYSPMWEVFANNPQLTGACIQQPGSTSATLLWDNGQYCRQAGQTIPYPGITHIENYLNLGARMAVNVYLSPYFHGQIGMGLSHDTAHNITYADAGRADPNTGRINLDQPSQVNPLYRPVVDAPGRRFRVEEATVFDFFINLTAQF